MGRSCAPEHLEIPGCAIAHLRFDASAPPRNEGLPLRLRRRDHLLHKARNAAYIAGRIDGIAEPHHDHVLRRDDHDALAEIPGGEVGVPGHAKAYTRLRIWMVAAIGPEASRVVGIECGGGTKVHPVLMQDALSSDDPV